MSGSIARRQALRNVSAAFGVISFGGLASAAAAKEDAGHAIGHRLLSRTIERSLKDSKRLIVSRSWSVSFEASGQGTVIRGSQRSVDVDAPARLAPLARIERGRSTDGMFPILLSDEGLIVAAGESHSATDMRKALSTAKDLLGTDSMTKSEERNVEATLRQIGQASNRLIETLPADLFFPRQPVVETRRPLALSNGTSGEFVMRYETTRNPATGLMVRAERVITTVLGGEKRASRELWTLS